VFTSLRHELQAHQRRLLGDCFAISMSGLQAAKTVRTCSWTSSRSVDTSEPSARLLVRIARAPAKLALLADLILLPLYSIAESMQCYVASRTASPFEAGTGVSPAKRSSDRGPPAFRDSRPGLVSVMDCPGIHAATTVLFSGYVVWPFLSLQQQRNKAAGSHHYEQSSHCKRSICTC